MHTGVMCWQPLFCETGSVAGHYHYRLQEPKPLRALAREPGSRAPGPVSAGQAPLLLVGPAEYDCRYVRVSGKSSILAVHRRISSGPENFSGCESSLSPSIAIPA